MLQFVTLHFSPAMCLLSTDQKIFGPFGILFNLSSHRRSTAGTGRGLDRGPPKTENCPSSEDVLLSSADIELITANISLSWSKSWSSLSNFKLLWGQIGSVGHHFMLLLPERRDTGAGGYKSAHVASLSSTGRAGRRGNNYIGNHLVAVAGGHRDN